jgi:SpoVK/Ycf46/Vps4 family AAA+-type ATPase
MAQSAVRAYADSYEHIADDLHTLDLRLARCVDRMRQMRTALPEQNGAVRYISDIEVDMLLRLDVEPTRNQARISDAEMAAWQTYVSERVSESLSQQVYLALPHLAQLFGLAWFELQTVVICLAPELRRKYDKLYAYLQDDITRKKPSIDLALELLCDTETERWRCRAYLIESARLFQAGILQATDDPQSPSGSSGAAQFLKLDERILHFVLGHNALDKRLGDAARLLQPERSLDSLLIDPSTVARALRFIDAHFANPAPASKRFVLYLRGARGVGKRELAEALCDHLHCPLLYVDVHLLLDGAGDAIQLLRLALREALLTQAAIYFDGIDALLGNDDKASALRQRLAKPILDYGWLTFLGGEQPWTAREGFDGVEFHTLEVPMSTAALRETAWQTALRQQRICVEDAWVREAAEQFRLTPRQIRDGVAALPDIVGDPCAEQVTLNDLYAAARGQSNQALEMLAQRIRPHHTWSDVILPADRVQQLRELCAQVRGRRRVLDEWGFGSKLSSGRGVSALFSGKPGTGKTMTSEVIAGELGLELYKIDLSSVVSKYIGETEKNLSRIFYEAETSNAILFFDEADALFGKRTEVTDAHDRYANIETSYLLQRMETYDGLVILATNLRDNLDEAFTRRIRFIIEFPFPDVTQRREIWRAHIPASAPITSDVDFDLLAAQLPLSGGSIRNIILGAAFFAAESDTSITMEHVVRAARREYEKIGKLWDDLMLLQTNRAQRGAR